MEKPINILSAFVFVLGASGMFAMAVRAESVLLPGTYRCSSYNVSGGGGSCRTMPPLVLHADGSYDFSSSRGRWSLIGGKLHLSESQLWRPGEILDSDSVRFEYDYRGWRHTVTWTCQECATAGPGTAGLSQGAYAPNLPETPQGYPPPHPVAQGGMPEGRIPETQTDPASPPASGPGGISGMQKFLNAIDELGKSLDGITKRGRKDGNPAYPGSDPPGSYQAAPSSYPGSESSATYTAPPPGFPASGPSVSDPPGYPVPPPSAYDAGRAAPAYGGTQVGQATMSPPPKCNPNIPKYSQPGCVE